MVDNDIPEEAVEGRHVSMETFNDDFAILGSVLDGLCLACRLNVLSFTVAWYTMEVDEDHQERYLDVLFDKIRDDFNKLKKGHEIINSHKH